MLPWNLVLLGVLLVATPLHGTPLPGREEKVTRAAEDYRLSENVVPKSYKIKITPDYKSTLKETEKFDGIVVITASFSVKEDSIKLHKGKDITITKICLSTPAPDDDAEPDESLCTGAEEISLDDDVTYSADSDTHIYEMTLPEGFNPNIGELFQIVLIYTATIPEGALTGFYKSTYRVGNAEHALLTTKFEPTHAREAFPCFDEPAFKATFQIFIDVKSEIDAISNMECSRCEPDSSSTDPAGAYTIKFEKSPSMSTYLVAFIVYETKFFTKVDKTMRPEETNLKYSTWGTADMIDEDGKIKGGFLSQVEGPEAIKFLEKYTGIPYTTEDVKNPNLKMTKMDMAAIPDFASGAMENWGLVTYRESSLLYNLQTGTTVNYKRVVDVIDHELTHMWFGNMVTLKWWNNVWLNEGFAQYMQYLIAHDRYPNWHMLERFVLDAQMGAFEVDLSSTPISEEENAVVTPQEIGNRFSTISYSKGASILRQIRNVLGEDKFKEGIRKYLGDKLFNSAVPTDLFESLVAFNTESVSKLNDTQLTSVLEDWTKKPGYPVINVKRKSNTEFTITQERFLLTKGENEDTVKYPVYLTWITSRDESPVTEPKSPEAWLLTNEDEKSVTIAGLGYNDWVLFNAYQGGYYRVNYDDAMWVRISNVLEQNEGANLDSVAPVDRAAIVDNALALARGGYMKYELAFQVIKFLRHDTAFEPWAAARSALAHLQRMLGNEEPFKEFVAYIVEKAYNATGFDIRMDSHIEKVHRTNVLTLACSAGYEPCLQKTQKLLQEYLKGEGETREEKLERGEDDTLLGEIHTGPVHPDLESVVFCYGLKGASPETWQELWKEYATSDAARRSTLVSALGCIDHREVLREFLQKSLTEDVRTQDAYTVFSSVYANTDGGAQVALDFLTFWGYEKLEARYGAVRNAMQTLMSGLANRLMTDNQKNQFEIALQNKDGTSRHESYVKTVESNIKWLTENNVEVLQMLNINRVSSYSSVASKNAVASTIAMICGGLMFLLR